MAGGERGEVREIEDVLDRLEVWHRSTATEEDVDTDRAEVPARR